MDKDKEKYHEYLKSPEWKEFRKKAFEHYGKKCAHCKRTKFLQIHHKTYENIFNEKLEDVMVLCELHHKKIHGLHVAKPGKKQKLPKSVNFKPRKKNKNRKAKRKLKRAIKDYSIKTSHPNLDAIIENKRRREMIRG